MKSLKVVLGLAAAFGLVGICFLHNRGTFPFVLAQGGCCNPPLQHPSTPRFPQGASVTVYINLAGGHGTSFRLHILSMTGWFSPNPNSTILA